MYTPDQKYCNFLLKQIVSNGLDEVLPLLEDGRLALPTREAYLGALLENTKREDYHCQPYRINHKSGTHSFLLKSLGISVIDLHATHPSLTPYLLAVEGSPPLVQAVVNSNTEEVNTWLASNVPATSSGINAGQSGVVGFLVSNKAMDVLDEVGKKVPQWAAQVDTRGRTTLFYANTPDVITSLISAGADPSIKDNSGKSLTTWWSANHTPDIASQMISSLQAVGVDGSPSIDDAMVSKVFHLAVDTLTDAEKEAFTLALGDSAWSWSGTLEGVKRKWSMEDIWNFGELAVLNDRIDVASPDIKKLMGYSGFNYMRNEPDKVRGIFAAARAQLPEQVATDWFANIRSPLISPFLALVGLLSLRPSSKDPYTKNTRQGYSSSSMWPEEVRSLYKNAVEKQLLTWSPQEHAKLPEAFHEMNDCRWAFDEHISDPLVSAIFSPTSSSAPLDRVAWGKVIAESPLKSPWHGSVLLGATYNIMKDPKLDPTSYPPELARAALKLVGTIPDSVSATVRRDHAAAQLFVLELLKNEKLEGQEVSSRWLRGFTGEQKSMVSNHLLSSRAAQARPAELSSRATPRM